MSLGWLYVVGAVCELVGGGLAALEIWRAGIKWRDQVNAPQQEHENGLYPIVRTQDALQDIFIGNRNRRLAAVALLSAGVIIGLIGNLASL